MNIEPNDKNFDANTLRGRISFLEERNAYLEERNATLAHAVLDLQETVKSSRTKSTTLRARNRDRRFHPPLSTTTKGVALPKYTENSNHLLPNKS